MLNIIALIICLHDLIEERTGFTAGLFILNAVLAFIFIINGLNVRAELNKLKYTKTPITQQRYEKLKSRSNNIFFGIYCPNPNDYVSTVKFKKEK